MTVFQSSMSNVTLDIFWIDFMPIYHHVIGASTLLLSALAIYLMKTKTPWHGRQLERYLIAMQVAILIVDFCWGFLVCPVLLFPLPGELCMGFICGSETGMHIGVFLILKTQWFSVRRTNMTMSIQILYQVLLFQTMIQVAFLVTCTLHYKYTTIVRMTNHRQVAEKLAVRLCYWIVLEIPVAGK
ncbi:hypothetical protein PRIPAC_85499 [Pristionchus pacificus]|uniref:G protein-coupled receptor n=1 Tax=Pristionchus pacificus TaxID=54126 RepID=A0A8R1YCW4_PRIPA|nr:hypothetical protein PRIPAC_85499 [Pristionchus pacificus]|eukprot:PDM67439.1 G protein-coupled receptor [Pristionchus pacificus]